MITAAHVMLDSVSVQHRSSEARSWKSNKYAPKKFKARVRQQVTRERHACDANRPAGAAPALHQ